MYTVNRWNPFEDLATLHRDMDRVFGRQWGENTNNRGDRAWTPQSEITTSGHGWRIRVALPGIDPEHVQIDLQGNTLRISGERPATADEDVQSHHSELAYGPFERTFMLPSNVNGAGVEAAYRDGILELTLPIAESAKPRRIEIGGGTNLKGIEMSKSA
jgi:HSP20 family protein